MTAPHPNPAAPQHPAPQAQSSTSPNLLRIAVWVAICALIAAAIVCVVWVLLGPDNGIIGRAFLTILLLAAFAGVAILDAHLAPRRPGWFALTSMVVWVVILLIGAFLIWMPEDRYDSFGSGFSRFVSFLLIVLVLQLALLHVRLYSKAHLRYVTGFTRSITWITLALVSILAVMLVVPLTIHEYVEFDDLYWRIVVAITILAAVGTAIIPLINALFAPKRPQRAIDPAYGYTPPPWPTYADGLTPLPVLPDGSPDWQAYYTGYPSVPQGQVPQAQAPAGQAPQGYAPAPQPSPEPAVPPASAASPVEQQPPAPPAAPAPGYQGYPPPPPAPPR